ncbi:MAG: molybdopterin-guanine dinucleotide biosynthesis protein B [Armatimonadota bacterium]
MNNIIALAGHSNSGKTTLIEKMIPEFKNRGYTVCVIKHILSYLDLDKEGKDTYRFAKAGADMVIMEDKETLAVVKKIKEEEKLENLINNYAKEYDLIIVEGFKGENVPQIGVYTDIKRVNWDKEKLIAVIGERLKDLNLPVFNRDDYMKVADFIEEKIIGGPGRI